MTRHYSFDLYICHLSTSDICALSLWLETSVEDCRPPGKYLESITRRSVVWKFLRRKCRLHHEKLCIITHDVLTVTTYSTNSVEQDTLYVQEQPNASFVNLHSSAVLVLFECYG
jgi:hypothetical protein